jgi:hypothetical protein
MVHAHVLSVAVVREKESLKNTDKHILFLQDAFSSIILSSRAHNSRTSPTY